MARLVHPALLATLLISNGSLPLLRAAHAAVADTPLLLTNARQVHDLPAALTDHAKVHLIGVVTYYDAGEHNLFIQDAYGAVYVDTDRPYPLRFGDLVSVDGIAMASYRTEVALNPTIRILARNQHISSYAATYPELASGNLDCRFVKLSGTVRAVNLEQHQNAPILHLDINMHGGEIEVYQPYSAIGGSAEAKSSGFRALPLLDSEVEIEGVAGGAFDTKSQLTGIIVYAQDSSAIRIVEKASMNALELPLSNIDTVFGSHHVEDTSTRVRVRGTLTYYKHGEAAVLEQDGKSIFIQTREAKDIPLGNVVDAVGFASDQEYAPSLKKALLFDTQVRQEISPKATSYDEALSGIYSDNLISLEGVLVSQLQNNNVETLVVDVGGHFVTARLEHTVSLPQIRTGTRLRLAGICRIVPGGPWRAPSFFHIEMRTPADLTIVSSPSWFTVQHLAELLGTLGALALATSAWAMMLRRRVRQQTGSIAFSMKVARTRSELLESISAHRTAHALLEDLCNRVSTLLPGADCCFSIGGESAEKRIVRPPSLAAKTLLHTTTLHDSEGKEVGHIQVFTKDPNTPVANQQEVCLMLSEVANLAMQQCLLYQSLVHHSSHDPLTDLPNRRLCEQRLQEALRTAANTNGRVHVVYIDVDRFKSINDRYGHKTGDLYLKSISSRLRAAIRGVDTLARVGGDEFIVIAPQKASDETMHLEERLHRCFLEPFELEGHCVQGSASMGVATFPEHGTTAEDLKRFADQAMYLSKHRVSSVEEPRIPAEMGILTPGELERAMEQKELTLSYQPQFSADGVLRGMEALLRLHDPILGTVTPDAFISIAEGCDTILPLGLWVLATALESAVRWGLHEGPPIRLCVNVALRQIAQPNFAATVLSTLTRYQFPPERLELELTERSLGADAPEITRQVQLLREASVRIAIDDFGTGYSALSLLHRLSVDTIKIDRSFILAISKEPDVLPVLEAIASMARSLRLRIVAEGVEEPEQLAALLQISDMDFQGYLWSGPVDASEVEQALRAWRAGVAVPVILPQERS